MDNRERLTFQFVWNEFWAFFSLEKGSLHTFGRLVRQPGKTIHAYLNGERGRLTNPIRFLLMACAIVTAVFVIGMPRDMYVKAAQGISFDEKVEPELEQKLSAAREMLTEVRDESPKGFLKMNCELAIESLDQSFAKRFAEASLTWMNVILLLALPVNAVISWVCFRNANLNFTEHIVANSYIIGIQNLMSIVLVPLAILNWVDFNVGGVVYVVASFAFQFLAWKQTFNVRGYLSYAICIAGLLVSVVGFVILQAIAMVLILVLA
ncbi:MAG: DUF3667 domain-containing protein [Mariniblastus sp.]